MKLLALGFFMAVMMHVYDVTVAHASLETAVVA